MTDVGNFRPKLIYLTQRNPTLSEAKFTLRWRQHAALGMSLPRWKNIARYVHCDCLRPSDAPPQLDLAYDGIGMIWHRSPAARVAHRADTFSRTAMEHDETATFSRPIVQSCVLARETMSGERSGCDDAARKLIGFWRSTGPESHATLAERRVRLASLLERAGAAPRGHAVNVPLPPELTNWGLDVERIEEWWFESEGAALTAVPLIHSGLHVPPIHLVLTNEVVLYEN